MNNRKIILNLATTLDWYIEWVNKEYDWCLTDQDYGFKKFLKSIDTIFMWKTSYEMAKDSIEEYFPNNKIIVFSKTLEDKNATIIKDNIDEEIKKMKSSKWKNIWMFWWAKLTKSLMDLKLIDQIQMAIHPILLWGWTPLFLKNNERIKLKLVSNERYSSWMVILKYDVLY